jgi:pimeloyl-ACP methyl ester carboxylesterase
MVRHPEEPRPWLVCVHGIRMGSPRGCFLLFRLRYLHLKLKLNILCPVLPIHGLRRTGPVSGDRVFSGDVMDAVHAGAQAMWDFRRLTAWLREEQDAPGIGVMGHSLGGYAAALLACLDSNLDCAFLGNPAVDPSGMFWRNAPSVTTASLKAAGVSETDMSTLMRVVSPLAMEPLLPKERFGILAGSGDRVIPATEAYNLWRHWDEPRIVWHHGSHRVFLHTPEGKTLLEDTLKSAGMLVEPG